MQEKNDRKPRILVAPLDWGLGHATRCIPVIHALLRQGAAVILAGEGANQAILTKEFPDLPFLPLQGYRIRYSRSSGGLAWKMLLQAPRLLRVIKEEHQWLEKMVREYQIDALISDNRFGLYHASIPCIFLTHQLRIKTSLGKWSEYLLQKKNYRFINRFTECWVPDNKGANDLAGQLSHPAKLPGIPVRYTGILSRMKSQGIAEKKNHLFVSLSGPEPQRTLLENIIVHEIGHYDGTATIVRGLPESDRLIPSTNDIRFYNHLPSEEYNKEMEIAEWVISRSGYSTVMDVITLGKRSILVPTPGQPEQEYLGKYLMQTKKALCISQKDFSLNEALKDAAGFKYEFNSHHAEQGLHDIIKSLFEKIK